jgi:hypothetical protein
MERVMGSGPAEITEADWLAIPAAIRAFIVGQQQEWGCHGFMDKSIGVTPYPSDCLSITITTMPRRQFTACPTTIW